MPSDPSRRPTAAEKADFADRLVDVLEDAGRSIAAGRALLRELRPVGNTSTYPMFDDGDKIDRLITQAADSLWQARRLAGIQGYEQARIVRTAESVHDNEGEAP